MADGGDAHHGQPVIPRLHLVVDLLERGPEILRPLDRVAARVGEGHAHWQRRARDVDLQGVE